MLPPLRVLHQRATGEAMKIDEKVPTMMPMKIMMPKSRSAEPPRNPRMATLIKVAPDVSKVRDRVALTASFMTFSSDSLLKSNISRTRSKTMMVSLIE